MSGHMSDIVSHIGQLCNTSGSIRYYTYSSSGVQAEEPAVFSADVDPEPDMA